MRKQKVQYDEEITRKEWRTKEGGAWVGKMVALGKKVAIVRWKYKWFPWFRIIAIIGPHNGGDGPSGPKSGTPVERKQSVTV